MNLSKRFNKIPLMPKALPLGLAAAIALSGCQAKGPRILEAIDRGRYVGEHISKVAQNKYNNRRPHRVENLSDGQVYVWLQDKSYAYNKPTGSSRYGPTITYHYERVNVSQALELAYRTDHNGIVRDIQYRYIRY